MIQEAAELFGTAKPFYWATGAMHSGETGSPEMLMEIVYRLAVEETPYVQEIRDHAVDVRALGQRAVGHRAHQAYPAAAVYDFQAGAAQYRSQTRRGVVINGRQAVAGGGVNRHPPDRAAC